MNRLPVFQLYFKLAANQSFFTVGDLECEYPSTHLPVRFSKERILKSSCTPVNPPTPDNVTVPIIFKEEGGKHHKGAAGDEHIFPFNQPSTGRKASTSPPNIPFRRDMYVPPTKRAQASQKGLEVSIAKDVIVPAIGLIGIIALLVFVYFVLRMIFRSRARARGGGGCGEFEEYEEESNRCSLFFRTSSTSRHESTRTTVQEIDRGYDKNALLELRTKYTTTSRQPATNRMQLQQESFVDYDYDDDDEDGGLGPNQRHGNETLHIDMNYKRRKKRWYVF